jgi:peroxiredoxin Q/BCP
MLQAGDPAPEFTLKDQNGEAFSLSSLRGRKNAVLFFYPRADTALCTKEACAFRDHFEEFAAADTEVIGISRDGQEAQFRFAERWKLPFRLLCDPNGDAERAFGVKQWLNILRNRITFVIDRSGTISAVIEGRFLAEHHVREALKAVRDQRKV